MIRAAIRHDLAEGVLAIVAQENSVILHDMAGRRHVDAVGANLLDVDQQHLDAV